MTSIDYASAGIDEMMAELNRIGTLKEINRAEAVIGGMDIVSDKIPDMRTQIMTLLACADWRHEFTPEGKAEREKIIDVNLEKLGI